MFVSIEGCEGTGKTTQACLLEKWLKEQDIPVLLTKEPGTIASKECRQIRELLLSPDNDMAHRAEFLLYLADRAQHVDKIIYPAIQQGTWVISDRYLDSTYVYQGYGRGLLLSDIKPMITWASRGLLPDVTFIMDMPIELGLSRAKSSNTEFIGGDRIEKEDIGFHEKLRNGFLQVYRENKYGRCTLLNANKTVEELHTDVINVIKEHINKE